MHTMVHRNIVTTNPGAPDQRVRPPPEMADDQPLFDKNLKKKPILQQIPEPA